MIGTEPASVRHSVHPIDVMLVHVADVAADEATAGIGNPDAGFSIDRPLAQRSTGPHTANFNRHDSLHRGRLLRLDVR